ncbi:splicing regulatory glutamine/lysine-rich protein 1-like [Mercenaria mercenaria]|uniref:splicing regulatory glutamine/lysine-rich protein 1-like n=1 Tax=Mercenaria mercenaria TaxID=6596 RepID=UPI00234E5609|nr:splicing regulatory glutamine/lysine-rich protein 1-like [Mercenaria mercenaria]
MNGKECSEIAEERKGEKKSVLPCDGNNGETRKGLNKRDEDDKSSKKKKTKKKKKDKSKKQTKKREENELVSKNTENTNREPEQEIIAVPSQSTDHADVKKKESKLPGCFGFISTWLAGRRQKRREKKKKAIADRATSPESGKQKIMKTPVVQPVKQTGGPIRREDYYRLKKAEARREDELAERCRSR